MYSYVACTVFWLFFTILVSSLGECVCKKKDFSENLLSGYLLYSFCVAVGGMIVQVLNLPWIIFAVYMAILWSVILCFVIRNFFKERKKIELKSGITNYLADNWMLLVVMLVLLALTLLYYAGFWLGNHQDDGYYISKAVTMPYTQTGGNFVYPLGVGTTGFNPYVVNTWEIEASVYIWLLKVSPTLYFRLFQSMFVFFLYLNLIKSLAKKIIERSGVRVKSTLAQLPVVVVIFFDAHYVFLSDTGLFKLRDMFMVNTGMFLGNSIVRVLGIPLLMYALIDKEKISIRMVVNAFVISVVLMSKSTIALPVIGIMAIAILMTWLVFEYGTRGKITAFIFGAVCVCVAVVLPNKEEIQSVSYGDLLGAVRSPIVWICIIIFVLSFFAKSKVICKLNMSICVMVALIAVPEINDIFEMFSVYGFVAGRAVANLVYFFVVVNMIYFVLILTKVSVCEVWIRRFYQGLAVVFTLTAMIGFKQFGGGIFLDQPSEPASIKYSLSVIKNNPYFIPNSTIALGEKLDKLSKKYPQQLRVVCAKMTIRDEELHPLSIWLRIYAKDIIPVSVTERYRANDGTALYEYTQAAFELFESNPSDDTAAAFWDEIKDLGVNCIVVQKSECAPWLEEKGFTLKDTVEGFYYIWSK